MPNRLKPLNQFDFTGGINLRPETFQLLENELPELLNMEVDPRGGLNVRKGWRAFATAPVVSSGWNPRSAYTHITPYGDRWVAVANVTATNQVEVFGRVNLGPWTEIAGASAGAPVHGADFDSWGDEVFITRGGTPTFVWSAGGVVVLTASGTGNWQDDYENPGVTDTAPQGEVVAQHAGYLFVANTREDSVANFNRVRWSHPNSPKRWAREDYIDITEGGQRITALISFSDRLLIFKPDSVWALFGYDAESWELTNISRTVGCVNQQAICRNEVATFFLSWPQGVFAYTEKGGVSEISIPIRTVFQDRQMGDVATVNSWLGWVGRRLWVSLPWNGDLPGPDDAVTVFVFDPTLTENGSWTMFRGAHDCVPGPYIERSDVDKDNPLAAFLRQFPYLVVLDAITDPAVDECEPGEPHGFPTKVRTRWIDAGAPTWKKSWRRPDFLMRALKVLTIVNCRVFHDYDSGNAQRSFTIQYTPDNPATLWGDYVWGDGTKYGGSDQT